ncbi:MAG: phytoene/squalene synthase family protein [Cytophagales bacterium]|nr:phytoene/squalene synthase family protein [Cytophagales bacterium]MDW8383316.1 phytoene/squalene synthase family protein [Flammeovirgaceae bacterium]
MDYIKLFNTTTFECSKIITQRYSTSFSLGIRVLDKSLHQPIYAIYGFVRYADEIVDTFHHHDKKKLLEHFKEETYRAIEERISLNPVLHAFQLTVNQYHIEKELIDAFLYSMELDLYKSTYDENFYQTYIYGSAEVVGLMCLHVFCNGDKQLYNNLKEPARRLGAAFQKVNFLRDMKSDYLERGRIYFPNLNIENFDEKTKKLIEKDIQADFDAALEGIKKLPFSARTGVYLAYVYYLKLFEKIKTVEAKKVLQERIRVPDLAKIWLLFKSYCYLHLSEKYLYKAG